MERRLFIAVVALSVALYAAVRTRICVQSLSARSVSFSVRKWPLSLGEMTVTLDDDPLGYWLVVGAQGLYAALLAAVAAALAWLAWFVA